LRIKNLDSLRQFPKKVFSTMGQDFSYIGPDYDKLGCLDLTLDDVFPFLVRRINARCAWCGQLLAWAANCYEVAKWPEHVSQLFLLS